MKIFFKRFAVAFFLIFAIVFLACGLFLIIPTNSELNVKSLDLTSDFTTFYDRHNNVLTTFSSKDGYEKLSDISEKTKQAFIASEDKNFYSHNGLDYLRMIKAAFVNIKNGAYLQGASTISQQLVKNTQLNNEKTLIRKLREIKLTQKLESTYSKDEILNMYLNGIYFGENCYGIESAARYYFGKSEKDLTLNELTMLVATIKSPSKVNPVSDLEKTKQKQSTVLKAMVNCGYITDEEAVEASKEKATIKARRDDMVYPYIKAVTEEMEAVTNLSPYILKNCKVYTGYDQAIQQYVYECAKDFEYDRQTIVIDNKSLLVGGYYTTCKSPCRSPASTIKPLAVYAPAIEDNYITQYTVIDDSPITIDGYSPENYKNKYYGNVTVRDALKFSLNVPAVKVLNAVGTDKAVDTINKLGFHAKDKALSLALGNVDGGADLKTLAGAYATFANHGEYIKPRFIEKIADEYGNVIYRRDDKKERIFSPATASVITDTLIECSKSGTAKKLKDLPFEVASKTGTNGNASGNVDAYCVSYTTDKTVASWVGRADSGYMPNSVTGGGMPTTANSFVLRKLYETKSPDKFEYKDVKTVALDKYSLEHQGRLLLADGNSPDKYVIKGLFKTDNAPNDKSTLFTEPKIIDNTINVKNRTVTITFEKPDFYRIKLYRKDSGGKRLVYDGYENVFNDTISGGVYEYSVIPVVKGKNGETQGAELALPAVTVDVAEKPVLPPEDWWVDDA